ncbi:unnamed protein product [Closterium sp. Yama58-4]|nr:unnamed protein product [Closterium sp. Yama58-4]
MAAKETEKPRRRLFNSPAKGGADSGVRGAARGAADPVPARAATSGGLKETVELGKKRGAWTAAEDAELCAYVAKYGAGNWKHVTAATALKRDAQSCRLRWSSHLDPKIQSRWHSLVNKQRRWTNEASAPSPGEGRSLMGGNTTTAGATDASPVATLLGGGRSSAGGNTTAATDAPPVTAPLGRSAGNTSSATVTPPPSSAQPIRSAGNTSSATVTPPPAAARERPARKTAATDALAVVTALSLQAPTRSSNTHATATASPTRFSRVDAHQSTLGGADMLVRSRLGGVNVAATTLNEADLLVRSRQSTLGGADMLVRSDSGNGWIMKRAYSEAFEPEAAGEAEADAADVAQEMTGLRQAETATGAGSAELTAEGAGMAESAEASGTAETGMAETAATATAAAAPSSGVTTIGPSEASSAVDFLMMIQPLKTLKRTGWVKRGVQGPESIGDHMHRMALMAFVLSGVEGIDRESYSRRHHPIVRSGQGGEASHGKGGPREDVCCFRPQPHGSSRKEEKHQMEREALEKMCAALGPNRKAAAGTPEMSANYDRILPPGAEMSANYDRILPPGAEMSANYDRILPPGAEMSANYDRILPPGAEMSANYDRILPPGAEMSANYDRILPPGAEMSANYDRILPPGTEMSANYDRILPPGAEMSANYDRILPPGAEMSANYDRILPPGAEMSANYDRILPPGAEMSANYDRILPPGAEMSANYDRILPPGAEMSANYDRILPPGARRRPGGKLQLPERLFSLFLHLQVVPAETNKDFYPSSMRLMAFGFQGCSGAVTLIIDSPTNGRAYSAVLFCGCDEGL